MNDDERFQEVRRLLDQNGIRKQLTASSLYLAAFQLLEFVVVERIKGFFGYDARLWKALGMEAEDGRWDTPKREWRKALHLPDSKSGEEIAGGERSDVRKQSVRWLVEMGAIDESEGEEIRRIVDHRNDIAHELPRMLLNGRTDLDELWRIRQLVNKIEIWWIREFEIAGSPLDSQELLDEMISPGNVVLLDFLLGAIKELEDD